MRRNTWLLILFLTIFAFSYAEQNEKEFVRFKIEKIDGNILKGKINKKEVSLKIAPKWYLDENGYSFKVGDEISVRYSIQKDVKNILEVIKENKNYKFVDEKGEFLWKRGGISGAGEIAPKKPIISNPISKENIKKEVEIEKTRIREREDGHKRQKNLTPRPIVKEQFEKERKDPNDRDAKRK